MQKGTDNETYQDETITRETHMIIAKRPTGWRVFSLIGGPLLAASGVYWIFLGLAANSLLVGVGGVTLLLMGISLPILHWRYRLILTDREITAIEAKTRSIEYSQIHSVKMRFGKLTLSSDQENLSITKDITEREKVLNFIGGKLTSRTDIKYEGDENDLFLYFNQKSPD
ncbi:MAG: hypothetical protein IPH75_10425 [bacterium]|nr:hypothetical protein [bacterium]